jgi:hypothetical protein
MIKANGAKLDWLRYDFATRDPDGVIWIWPGLDDAQADAAANPAYEVVMRAVYVTGWTETL